MSDNPKSSGRRNMKGDRNGSTGPGKNWRRRLREQHDPPLGRREEKKLETRAIIYHAARTLFETRGFEGTTIRAIAEEAGVGIGTVHLHFKDKEGLLLACTIDELEAADRYSWASIPEDAPIKEQLLQRATDGFERWAQQPSLAKAILRNLYFSRRPEICHLRALDEEAILRIADQLRTGQERGEVREDADPELAARGIFSFYLTSILDWLGGIEGDPLEQEAASHSSSARKALDEKVLEAKRFLDQVFMGIGTGQRDSGTSQRDSGTSHRDSGTSHQDTGGEP